MRKTRTKEEKKAFWLKVVELTRDARGRILELHASATTEPLPARHALEERWLRFDHLEVIASGPGYVFRYRLGGVLVKQDHLTVPQALQNQPADLLAWAVMRGWRSSDLLILYPRLDGTNDAYHYPPAPKLTAGKKPRRRVAGPVLFAPTGAG